MNDRMLQKQIDQIKSGDTTQDTDITELKAAVGEVGETSLQEQITALEAAVGEVGETSLQGQITALEARVKALEDA